MGFEPASEVVVLFVEEAEVSVEYPELLHC
jgi:hypothetical protein